MVKWELYGTEAARILTLNFKQIHPLAQLWFFSLELLQCRGRLRAACHTLGLSGPVKAIQHSHSSHAALSTHTVHTLLCKALTLQQGKTCALTHSPDTLQD